MENTERQITRKAMAFDIFEILDEKPEKDNYTREEIKKLIRTYLTTVVQR